LPPSAVSTGLERPKSAMRTGAAKRAHQNELRHNQKHQTMIGLLDQEVAKSNVSVYNLSARTRLRNIRTGKAHEHTFSSCMNAMPLAASRQKRTSTGQSELVNPPVYTRASSQRGTRQSNGGDKPAYSFFLHKMVYKSPLRMYE
jgi:hypothetical protein